MLDQQDVLGQAMNMKADTSGYGSSTKRCCYI